MFFRDELAQRGFMTLLPAIVWLVSVMALLTEIFVAHLDDHLETLSRTYLAHNEWSHHPIFFKDLDALALSALRKSFFPVIWKGEICSLHKKGHP